MGHFPAWAWNPGGSPHYERKRGVGTEERCSGTDGGHEGFCEGECSWIGTEGRSVRLEEVQTASASFPVLALQLRDWLLASTLILPPLPPQISNFLHRRLPSNHFPLFSSLPVPSLPLIPLVCHQSVITYGGGAEYGQCFQPIWK